MNVRAGAHDTQPNYLTRGDIGHAKRRREQRLNDDHAGHIDMLGVSVESGEERLEEGKRNERGKLITKLLGGCCNNHRGNEVAPQQGQHDSYRRGDERRAGRQARQRARTRRVWGRTGKRRTLRLRRRV